MRNTAAALVVVAAGFVVALSSGCPGRPDPGNVSEGTGEGEGEGAGVEGEGEVAEGEGADGEGEGPVVDGIDLLLDVTDVEPSVKVTFREFAIDACEVDAQRVDEAGIRALLSFDLVMRNNGTDDLSVGVADSHLAPSPCDAGDALIGFIDWKITTLNGAVAGAGSLDVAAGFSLDPDGGTAPVVFTASSLLDVTDAAPLQGGDFILELTVDPDGVFDDNPANNSIRVPIPLVNMACRDTVCGGTCCPADKCEDDRCMLADLTVDREVLADSAQIIESFFGDESCGVFEGCVAAAGNRRLLNFSTTTPNHGNTDLVVGDPSQSPLFSFSECHQHFHFDQYANYRLLAPDGSVAATGHKQAFCLEDLEPMSDDAPNAQFDCSDQGITVGWADTYGRHLDCQWIDVTDVPPGDYLLEVAVNPARILVEIDYTDNVVRVPVSVPEDPNRCIPAAAETCGNGRDETCDNVPDDGCAPLTDNDSCAAAHYIDGSGLFQGSITSGAGSEVAPSCGGGGGGGALFFQFDVSTPGIVYMSTYGSAIDTTLSVFAGNDCATETLCVDDGCGDVGGGAHFLSVMEAGPYTAVVKAKAPGATGLVQFKLQQGGCGDAQATFLDVTQAEVNGDTSNGLDNTAPSCVAEDGGGDGPDQMWYFATCPGPHATSIQTCGGGLTFDSALEVRDGACLGRTFQGACDDDLVPGQRICSDVETTLEGTGAGDGLWFLLVDGYDDDDSGTYTLRTSIE